MAEWEMCLMYKRCPVHFSYFDDQDGDDPRNKGSPAETFGRRLRLAVAWLSGRRVSDRARARSINRLPLNHISSVVNSDFKPP